MRGVNVHKADKNDAEYIRADLVPQWKPIETAPINVLVDIWVKAKRSDESGRFTDYTLLSDGTWFGARRMYSTDKPTHWQPRPTPPPAT